MNKLELKNITRKFAESRLPAVDNFSLEVKKGEIAALLGESGCGKTTILRMIAGFEIPDKGQVLLNGQIVSSEQIFIEPQRRRVGLVFQDYALFPHKTVWDNITFGLFRLSKEKAAQKASEIISLSDLTGLEKRYPHQLSGGQKQRVAIARALAPGPELILFDEPFSNIDSMLRYQMREHIKNIIKKTGATAIIVTHDTKDVMSIADKVSVIRKGKHIQTDNPENIYNFPVNTYVANFFGKANFIRADITKDGYLTPFGMIKVHTPLPTISGNVMLSIRPEEFIISHEKQDSFCGVIVNERFMGEFKELTCKIKSRSGEELDVIIYAPPYIEYDKHNFYFKPIEDKINILIEESQDEN